MATHRCGTCFFLQEAGFAGNGWCLHADRAKSADVRTLVRKNELACRNDWGQSLWTDPKHAAETGAARKLITAQAERPATEGEIGFMVNPRDGQADSRPQAERIDRSADDAPTGEDVVVGQITVMPPGMTGRRRLVDQVPVELPTREPFRASLAADERPGTATSAEPLLSRPGRSIASPADREPASPTLSGRDRNRPQRTLPKAADRPSADSEEHSSGRRDLADPMGMNDHLQRRRDRLEPISERRSVPFPAEAPVARSEGSSDRSRPGRPMDESPSAAAFDIGSLAGTGPELPRGLRPAPIPGPVPSRELRGDREPESHPVMSNDARRQSDQRSAQIDESAPVHRPSRPMPSPILDESGSLSVGPPARSQPSRRPALPDLPDDFFTRGVIGPAPSDPDIGHGSPRDRQQDRRAVTRPMSQPAATPPAPEARAGRPRPAVPRLGADQDRQIAPAPIPTVAEANRQDWAPPTARPVQTPGVTASPRPDTGWAAPRPVATESARPGSRRPILPNDTSMADEEYGEERGSVRLEPPIPLRPQSADFGAYGGWFDLQSVEPRLAPQLQRSCETCRDFRPSENGERGWCTNRDAFTLRTVVNATDLPCISSFGCWWVPFDDIWLSEAAIRGHRNPTPLLDQTIGPEENLPATGRQRRGSR